MGCGENTQNGVGESQAPPKKGERFPLSVIDTTLGRMNRLLFASRGRSGKSTEGLGYVGHSEPSEEALKAIDQAFVRGRALHISCCRSLPTKHVSRYQKVIITRKQKLTRFTVSHFHTNFSSPSSYSLSSYGFLKQLPHFIY